MSALALFPKASKLKERDEKMTFLLPRYGAVSSLMSSRYDELALLAMSEAKGMAQPVSR
jgi:hypothetical protein